MGYNMSVESNTLKANGLRTLPEDVDDDLWEITNDDRINVEQCFKWTDHFEEELVFLARVGVTGEIELKGEQGDYVKYVLKNGIVESYEGEVTYPEKPTSVLGNS